VPIDAEGNLVNDCRRKDIAAPWSGLLDEYAALVRQGLAADLHSLYVRGSVARGTALPGIADLDGLALTAGAEARGGDALRGELHELQQRRPFCRQIAVEILPVAKLLAPDCDIWLRLRVKVESVCLWGEDITSRLAPIPFDARLVDAPRFHRLDREIQMFRQRVATLDEDGRRAGCQWLMKNVLRLGYQAIMLEVGAYTRDLSLCFEGLAKRFPEHEAGLQQVLTLAVEPTAELAEMDDALTGVTGWLIEEARRRHPLAAVPSAPAAREARS
jgi:hypothetical protein